MSNSTKNRSRGAEDVLKPDEPAARQASPIREGKKKEQIAKTFAKNTFLLRRFGYDRIPALETPEEPPFSCGDRTGKLS
jgi:hypothetical protein